MTTIKADNPAITHSYYLLMALLLFLPFCVGADSPKIIYLGDMPENILRHSQAWGQLGIDTAAHAPDRTGLPLQIGTRHYSKGLGHHANGELVVLLDGAYSLFEAEVGLQPCGSTDGSVVFRVYVDNEKRFESGVLRATDDPVSVRVHVESAQELRLEAADAGDGITCDMANWAEARLTRSTSPTKTVQPEVDIARFGRIVTWDPNRKEGCRSNRLQEFSADDLFLEKNVVRSPDGTWSVPMTSEAGCIGVQWLCRRAIRELRLCLPGEVSRLPIGDIHVEGWFGESAWQGQWKQLDGNLSMEGTDIVFRPLLKSYEGTILQTLKIRWILPPIQELQQVRTLKAFTRTRWDTANILIQADKPSTQQKAGIAIYNGEFLDTVPAEFVLSSPIHLSVRHVRSSVSRAEQTVLQFILPSGSLAVAVSDILANECVYLPEYGLFITRDPSSIEPAEYRKKIAERKTILQEVRSMPDQTLEQAMAHTRNPAQDEGPVMLSLACDNTKYVVDRNGTLRFHAEANPGEDWYASAGAIVPQWKGDKPFRYSRKLDGGWLPISVLTWQGDGLFCTEQVFVAPVDEPGDNPARPGRRGICAAEFKLSNRGTSSIPISLSLDIWTDQRKNQSAKLVPNDGGFRLEGDKGQFGWISRPSTNSLKVNIAEGRFELSGDMSPQADVSFVIFLPSPGDPLPIPLDIQSLRRDTELYWKAVLSSTMQIETPEPFLNDLIRSSQVRCLIAARNEAQGSRVAPWIAAMSYGPLESEAHSVIRGMDFLGHSDFARRGLEFFIHRYNAEGFLTTGYTTFGTAWHLWTLGEHVRLSGDFDWVKSHSSELIRVGEWIVRQTGKTCVLNSQGEKVPEYGLMPPGVMADWNSFAYHFCMNAYYYAALRDLGRILSECEYPQGREFQTQADELCANLLRAYRWTQAQSPVLPLRNGTWIPRYPSQVHSPGHLGDFFPGQDAGRSWCYDVELGAHQLVPTGVFGPDDPEVTRMMDHMEDVQFLSDGWFDYPAEKNHRDWFNRGGFSKVQPYYTRNAEIYALRDEIKPFLRSYFNSIASLVNTEVMTFWEHFFHSGAWDKTHETGYFLHQTRSMFVMERGRSLWLAPLIPSRWLQAGKTISVNNAPTCFGPVSFTISSRIDQGGIELQIAPPKRTPPDMIVVRLRHPDGQIMKSVEVNGRPYQKFDPKNETIEWTAKMENLSVLIHY